MDLAHADAGQPIVDLNTTPLIDVLLVLLVMFIITIPIQTHAIKMDLPVPCSGCPAVDPLRNHVAVTAEGRVLWNGSEVTQSELNWLLARAAATRPLAELHLQPDPQARYKVVNELLGSIRRAGVTNVGFVGNERYRVS